MGVENLNGSGIFCKVPCFHLVRKSLGRSPSSWQLTVPATLTSVLLLSQLLRKCQTIAKVTQEPNRTTRTFVPSAHAGRRCPPATVLMPARTSVCRAASSWLPNPECGQPPSQCPDPWPCPRPRDSSATPRARPEKSGQMPTPRPTNNSVSERPGRTCAPPRELGAPRKPTAGASERGVPVLGCGHRGSGVFRAAARRVSPGAGQQDQKETGFRPRRDPSEQRPHAATGPAGA